MTRIGEELYAHVGALYPIFRSITGPGLRQTLDYIGRQIPLRVQEIPSGTQVLDWVVPPEWSVRSATIETRDGRTVVDFAEHGLHLVHYSQPIDRLVPLDELQEHLHSLPDQPTLIPYRTSYYKESWGFCLAHEVRTRLRDPAYRVRIDTTLAPGSLSLGEAFLPGDEAGEVLISAHICHPQLANDNLSGIAVAIALAQKLTARRRRFGYRFLFMPGTIGAVAWLHQNRDARARIHHGLVLTCLGDPGPPTYKRSRQGASLIDRCAAHVLSDEGFADRILPFTPWGYDERQYCSPGFDLPVGCLMRSPSGAFPEYHTSADDLSLVTPAALADSLSRLDRILSMAEDDHRPVNAMPYGEPQLGPRGLYFSPTDDPQPFATETLLWVLNLSDARHSLLDIAERAGRPFEEVAAAARVLSAKGLLRRAEVR
ncbi:DUF4910 domain-containing protein [Hansschlegelia zhihuaiae]|uniref:DUF4910 domain-containing protein n=1 Tax=Hansschlegelia zhihuaiae TaxID=405005 RepID=A0A4Q0MC66_9HYPH|nr:DUF4910 domain-containing protein [Hansschlegelia zhihuaiae]RXF70928.1 DUF4910 domain-containing protein [Hansschlegelia zhihuaiae]